MVEIMLRLGRHNASIGLERCTYESRSAKGEGSHGKARGANRSKNTALAGT